jgi:hypothetical protein
MRDFPLLPEGKVKKAEEGRELGAESISRFGCKKELTLTQPPSLLKSECMLASLVVLYFNPISRWSK